MKYVVKRRVVLIEWYEVEASTVDEAIEESGQGQDPDEHKILEDEVLDVQVMHVNGPDHGDSVLSPGSGHF